jgi:hypothetical protein
MGYKQSNFHYNVESSLLDLLVQEKFKGEHKQLL